MRLSPGRRISSWGKLVEFAVFPSFCELCHTFLDKPGEKAVCRSCLEKVRASAGSFCLCCGRFFESAGEPHFCRRCLETRPPFSKHRSCAPYEGILKEIILLFKYRGFEVLGQYLGDFIWQSRGTDDDLWHGVEAIMAVPLHPKKEKKRGFNQAQVLAQRLARRKGIALVEKRLLRVRNVPAQTSLEARERETNVRGAFRMRKGEDVRGKIVLLVDDVYTTGSTLRECSRVLLEAGAKEVRALTIAQA